MIAYMLQCHTNFKQVARLLSWLYDKDDFFVLSCDGNTKIDYETIADYLSRPNVIVGPAHRITWGGASIVQATLSSMLEALKFPGWKYFINLSGLDIPLLPRLALLSELDRFARENVHNFISDFGEIEFSSFPWSVERMQEVVTLEAPNSARIVLSGGTGDLTKGASLAHSDFRPVTEPALRLAFFVSEAQGGRSLSCRPLYPFEAASRARFSARHGFRFGRQWVVLHRDACDYLLNSEQAQNVYHVIRDAFIPDELFFQTAMGDRGLPSGTFGIKADNKRFFLGEPVRVTDRSLEAIKASKCWFARKIVVEEAAGLISYLNETVGCHG